MAEDTPDKPEEGQEKQGVIRPLAGVKMASHAGVTAKVRVRLIQTSPDADPKLVEVARQIAQELKENQGDVDIDYIPEAPLVLPNHK